MVYDVNTDSEDDFMQFKKRLLLAQEFASIASGSNEGTNIQGNKDWVTVGGHVDTAGDRMTSYIGCEECCGYLEQWFEEYGGDGTDHNDKVYDGLGWFGKVHSIVLAMFVGCGGGNNQDWLGSSTCGSRAYNFCSGVSLNYLSVHIGSRGICNIKA